MANNTLMHGVYRQRSCDNSGKFPHLRIPPRNPSAPNIPTHKFNFNRNNFSNMSTNSLEQNAIPKNFKFVSPQSRYENSLFNVNSLPRYPKMQQQQQQCKNRSIYNDRSNAVRYYYHHDSIRHPSTPPPPPPFVSSPSFEEQLLLHTSSSSGENFCNNTNEYDPILNSVCKHSDYYGHVDQQQNLHQAYHNPNKRNSNIYEYRFYSLELNSFHEFDKNTS